MSDRPWPAGAATGVGSLPGTDPGEAAALVFGELPELPHLPELPARGPGAQMIGRAAALLVELPVEIAPTGWRLAGRPGRDLTRARDLLARDLDALEEHGAGWTGALKLQATGPWTLAASLELPSGHRVVSDHGAMRDLTESLAEGLRTHLADVTSRLPGAVPVLQLDEPGIAPVLAGRVPTPSGYGTVRAVDRVVVEQGLRDVLAVAPEGGRVVHCCAPSAPVPLFAAAGADAVSLDAALITSAGYDALGEFVDGGGALWLGVVPTSGPEVAYDAARQRVRTLWGELGFGAAQLPSAVVPTPACGLAGVPYERARRALRTVRDVGRSLLDES